MRDMSGRINGASCLDILYEDKHILVCHKRPGMAVQSARTGQMDLECALKNYLAEKMPGRIPYLGVVHRLDQPVEGLLVFAKSKPAAAALNRQLGDMHKEYLAVVRGRRIPGEKRELRDLLVKENGRARVVSEEIKGAKKARLDYEVLACGEQASLLRIRLYTGRFHQIRCQLAHAGMPVMGDVRYGQPELFRGEIGLCAVKLSFTHPGDGRRMAFEQPPSGKTFQEFGELQGV